MNKGVLVGIALVVALGAGTLYFTTKEVFVSPESQKAIEDGMALEEKGDMMEKNTVPEVGGAPSAEDSVKDDMMKKDDAMTDEKMMGDTMMKMGVYEPYSADKLMRAETGDVVLFFHASWCPSCRGLNASIEEHMKEIPEGVSILKVNYDTETELKRKYGVTYQHTLVQVDKDGNLIKKWSGSQNLNALVTEIE